MLNKKQNLDIIKEASALNTFNKLRYDLNKLTNALYVVEVINTFCADTEVDIEQNNAIYDLLYATLNNIQNSKSNVETTLNVIKFQLHFMNITGFGIEFEKCLKCSKKAEGTVLLSLQSGGIVCPDCASEQLQYIRLHEKLRNFLNILTKTNVNIKTEYDSLVNEKVTDSCFNLLKKYIEITANKKSKTFKVMEATKVS